MNGTRPRSAVKSVVTVLCAVCFLTMSLGSVSRAVAADTFETWPKNTADPGAVAKPALLPEPAGAAKEGSDAGKDVTKGTSAGTIAWWAAGTAGVIAIAVAVGGGGGSTSNH